MKLYEAIEKALENPELILINQGRIRYRLVSCNPSFILVRLNKVDENPPLYFHIEGWINEEDPRTPENIKAERPTAKAMLSNDWEIEEPKEEFKSYSVDVWCKDPNPAYDEREANLVDRVFGCFSRINKKETPEYPHKFKITVERADEE